MYRRSKELHTIPAEAHGTIELAKLIDGKYKVCARIPRGLLQKAPGDWANTLQARWHHTLHIDYCSLSTRIIIPCTANDLFFVKRKRADDLKKDLEKILQITVTIE